VNPDGAGVGVTEDGTFYTQVNMTQTTEQILGLTPMNQFDLVASPMTEIFVDNPPAVKPELLAKESHAGKALRAGWMKKKDQIFARKLTKPDSEDPNTVNHLDWYEATGFTRPYPGESKVLPASAFKKAESVKADDDD